MATEGSTYKSGDNFFREISSDICAHLRAMGDPFLFLRDAVFAVMVLKLFAVFAKGFIEIFVSLAVALAIEEIHPEQAALSIQELASTFP